MAASLNVDRAVQQGFLPSILVHLGVAYTIIPLVVTLGTPIRCNCMINRQHWVYSVSCEPEWSDGIVWVRVDDMS